ncbi:MAG TPA: serine hydrolase [Candidatus Paceibacterota bacterium]|nr:serine hydrolase [Candidatus Paceibacterota bacterium]
MTETSENKLQNNRFGSKRRRALGALTLALVFISSALFTYVYFNGGNPAINSEVAAVDQSQATVATTTAFDNLSLQAKSAIVIDTTTGRELFEQNADAQLPLASLTKVALVLVVTSALPKDGFVSVPPGAKAFPAGSMWKLSDFVDYTLAISSNEGADILAENAQSAVHTQYPQSSEDDAVLWRMNDLAHQLGMTHTYFLNHNGLDDSPTQSGAYGSARDMAALFAYAASTNLQAFSATTQQSFTITSMGGSHVTAINTDEALPSIPGILMGKTGYTDLAGGNLAVVFDENGHRIVAVVLGSTQQGRFSDMEALVADTGSALSTP